MQMKESNVVTHFPPFEHKIDEQLSFLMPRLRENNIDYINNKTNCIFRLYKFI